MIEGISVGHNPCRTLLPNSLLYVSSYLSIVSDNYPDCPYACAGRLLSVAYNYKDALFVIVHVVYKMEIL